MEHAQKIQAAFAAYLAGITPSPWAEDLTDADGNLRIFTGQEDSTNDSTKDGTRIVCAVVNDLTETPTFSGNRWADVEISLKTPVADDGGVSFGNHQANAAALESALMDTGLVAGLQTADLYVYQALDRNTYQAEDESAWESGMKLRVYSVEAAA